MDPLKRAVAVAFCLAEVGFILTSIFLGIAAASAGEAGLNAVVRAVILLGNGIKDRA